MTKEQILQIIGQLEKSIDKIEPYLSLEDFKDYCDTTMSSIAQWKVVLKQIKEKES